MVYEEKTEIMRRRRQLSSASSAARAVTPPAVSPPSTLHRWFDGRPDCRRNESARLVSPPLFDSLSPCAVAVATETAGFGGRRSSLYSSDRALDDVCIQFERGPRLLRIRNQILTRKCLKHWPKALHYKIERSFPVRLEKVNKDRVRRRVSRYKMQEIFAGLIC